MPISAETLIDVSDSGQTALVEGIEGQIIEVFRLFLVCNGEVDLKFQDGDTDLCPAMNMSGGGAVTLDENENPWFTTAPGNSFNIDLSDDVQVSGRLYYSQRQP